VSPGELRLVDTITGEVQDTCGHCTELERDLRVKRGQITKLKNENRRLAGLEPEADKVLEVLTYWRDTVRPRASIIIGSDSWKAVKARLTDTDVTTGQPAFTVLSLKAAVVGLTLDEWHMDPRARHRRDLNLAFSSSDKVTKLLYNAVRFKRTYAVSALTIIDELGGEALVWLAERCACDHLWIAHLRGGAAPGGLQPCSCEGCGCENFDFFTARVERWMAEHEGGDHD